GCRGCGCKGGQVVSGAERARRIGRIVRRSERELRRRFTLLQSQDALAIVILVGGVSGMIASGWLYLAGSIPWWCAVPLSAFFASLLHELEHDQIHQLYFKRAPT